MPKPDITAHVILIRGLMDEDTETALHATLEAAGWERKAYILQRPKDQGIVACDLCYTRKPE